MAQGNDHPREQDPILVLVGVVKYILRSVPLPEAVLNNSGAATKAGFYVSHNPDPGARAVLVEALGYDDAAERAMIERYKTAIGRALRRDLGVNPDTHVVVANTGDGPMLRVTGLSNEQITRLRQRHSAG